jgi:cytochrome c biogenesis protein CcmG/thiol:disulfide interchange protein DsbE
MAIAVPPGNVAPAHRRWRATIVASVVLVLLAGIGWSAARVMGGGVLGQDPFGRQAPAFRLPRVDGDGSVALAGLRGSPVVLNFWASWCQPCRQEAAVLASAQRRWHERGVVFVGIDTTDRTSDAIAFERRYGVRYPSVADRLGQLQVTYGVLGFPETFFLGADGTIVAKYVGPIDRATLDEYLAMIVAR